MLETSLPLRCSPNHDSRRSDVSATCMNRSHGGSTWSGVGAGKGKSVKTDDRSSRVAAARDLAISHRAQLMRQRAADTKLKLVDHRKQQLKLKIVKILEEVQRRQKLQQQQEKAQRWRETHGIKAPGQTFGEATDCALGLAVSDNDVGVQAAAIVDSLTMEELDRLRRDPIFFFGGSVANFFGVPTEEGEDPTENIVSFFIPTDDATTLPIETYAKTIRAGLNQSANAWRQFQESFQETSNSVMSRCSIDNTSLPPLERMPCLGRRPAVSSDDLSPTYAQVREVYDRRCATEAKLAEEKSEAMVQRETLNASKVAEQQRQQDMRRFEQRELHKIRLIQAMENKADLEAQKDSQRQLMMADKNLRLICACEKAEDRLEEKRRKISDRLEAWDTSTCQAENYLRNQEHNRITNGKMKWDDSMRKTWDLGCARHMAFTERPQNDVLKKRVQASLLVQLDDMRQRRSVALAENIDAKQEAAATRRHQMYAGSRYHLREKAFGNDALLFDPKHHSVAVDRRDSCWKQNAQTWAHLKGTFSEPALSATCT